MPNNKKTHARKITGQKFGDKNKCITFVVLNNIDMIVKLTHRERPTFVNINNVTNFFSSFNPKSNQQETLILLVGGGSVFVTEDIDEVNRKFHNSLNGIIVDEMYQETIDDTPIDQRFLKKYKEDTNDMEHYLGY